DDEHSVVESKGDVLYIHTNLDAPNFILVIVNIADPKPKNWKDLNPESENVLSVETGDVKILVHYLKDETSLVVQFDMEGKKEREIKLPGVGSAAGFSAKQNEKELYYTFTSYVYPSTIFKYNIASGKSEE